MSNSLTNRPKILVTNDDGIDAEGIHALWKSMQKIGDAIVVAPDSQRSAASHSLTLSKPFRAFRKEHEGHFFGWAVTGTPVDCVKLGLQSLLDFKPDLIVSGINHGSNTGTNVVYSGTVAAAAEGALIGIPSIAFSLISFTDRDFSVAAEFAGQLAKKVLQNGLAEGTMLTVNIPSIPQSEIKGVKITRMGKGRFQEAFEKRTDPNGREYYWLGGKKLILDFDDDIDEVAVNNGYISVTPIQFDLTNHHILAELNTWGLSF